MLHQASVLQARDEAEATHDRKLRETEVGTDNPGGWRRVIPNDSNFVKRETFVRNGITIVKPYEVPKPESVGVSFVDGGGASSHV